MKTMPSYINEVIVRVQNKPQADNCNSSRL